MSPVSERGQRLIATLIDAYAKDHPTRKYASIPRNNDDLRQGFQDINYKQLANAIDQTAWWLSQHVSPSSSSSKTWAYVGPKDLRYPIMAVAALKCGKPLLLCSPFATAAAQHHLLRSTECSVYLYAASLGPLVKSIVSNEPNVQAVGIPDVEHWLWSEDSQLFPYTKSWAEGQSDPWLIIHTSGTTGLPKPIVYTNWMMTSFDAAELMPDAGEETMNDHFRDKRFYVSLPNLHVKFTGMTAALQWTVFLNTVLITGPPGAVTSDQIIDILEQGQADGALLTPAQIDDICQTARGLEALRRLEYLYFVGAPLPRSIAKKLLGYCKVQPGMGTTEAGAYFVEIRNDDDWEYYRFRPSMGADMRQKTDKLYELVFRRQPELERWQQLFKIYPELDEYATKDLWSAHPTTANLWRYEGRSDDFVNLLHGEGLHVTEVEAIIRDHSLVRSAIVGGERRPFPFLILDLKDQAIDSERRTGAILDEIWPQIEKANEKCFDNVKLRRNLVIITDAKRPLPRNIKDTVIRQQAIALYLPEIERLYSE
ncbi:MAG: hypothetical protein M1820_010602 [Bogoriella megaspora]|nr:MAG: hypothetical protein M1820_010602 [Bogoriella megaspora]